MKKVSKWNLFALALALILLTAGQCASEAEIKFFDIDKESIKPGEKATLSWEAINTTTCTLESNPDPNDAGAQTVACKGSQEVSPSVTTNYQLSALKQNNQDYVTKTKRLDVETTTAVCPQPAVLDNTACFYDDTTATYGP